MTASAATGTRTALLIGQILPWTSPEGWVTVTLQRVNAAAFVVTTYQGPNRLEDWCRAYADETSARTAARHAANAFRAYSDERDIEARRDQLVAVIAEETTRARRSMHNAQTLAAAEAEYDALLTLADLASLDQLRTDLADEEAPVADATDPRIGAEVKVGRRTYRIEQIRPCDWRVCADDCTAHAVAAVIGSAYDDVEVLSITSDGRFQQPGRPTVKIRRSRRVLTPVDRHTSTTLRVGQPGTAYRGECWSAVSKDGVWRYDREDEPGTPWYIKHLPTGRVIARTWDRLDDARYATANGEALRLLEAQPVNA